MMVCWSQECFGRHTWQPSGMSSFNLLLMGGVHLLFAVHVYVGDSLLQGWQSHFPLYQCRDKVLTKFTDNVWNGHLKPIFHRGFCFLLRHQTQNVLYSATIWPWTQAARRQIWNCKAVIEHQWVDVSTVSWVTSCWSRVCSTFF